MKAFLTICLMCLFGLAKAQSEYILTSYPISPEFTQNSTTSIVQDHKGVIWLSTWDGLNKFDGYNFQNYKNKPEDPVSLSNNRIVQITTDKIGFIWAVCYDYKVSRFNPETETFEPIKIPSNFMATSFTSFNNGHIWIHDRLNSLICMDVDSLSQQTKEILQFQCKGNPDTERLILYNDNAGNEWILASESGLYQIKENEMKVNHIKGSNKQGFYTVFENRDEVLFGSDNGEIWHYQKQQNKLYVQQLNVSSRIKYINQYKNSIVYATANDGFFIQEIGKGIKQYHIPQPNPQTKGIRTAYLDKNGILWIETNAPEATLYDLNTQQYSYIPFKDITTKNRRSYNLTVIEDNIGNEWIYPYYGGLAYYKHGQLIPYTDLSKELSWNASDNHFRFFSDKQNNLWIATTRYTGKISTRSSLFHKTLFNRNANSLPEDNTFRSILQDYDGRIWVGNKTGELLLYDTDFQFIGKLTPDGKITQNTQQDTFLGMAYAIKQDHNGRIWVGTKGKGLLCITPNGNSSYKIEQFKHNPKDPYSLSSNNLYDIYEDHFNRIWIGSYEGGLNYVDESNPSKIRFIHWNNLLKEYPQQADKIYCITSDKSGHIWLGTSNGIVLFNEAFDKPEDIKFKMFQHIPGDIKSLSNNNVQYIYPASNGQMYIATFGGGLCQAEIQGSDSMQFTIYSTKEGLQSDIIFSIQEDDHNNLWLASGSGLIRFNTQTKAIENWDEQQIGFDPLYNEGRSIYTSDDEIVFLSLYGLFHFNPDHIVKSNYAPSIIFTQLILGGKVIQPQKGSILPKNLEYMECLEIPHEENYFTIRFAALEMTHPTSVSYAYKLEGFDKDWRETGNQRTVTYTNLSTGTYKLCVRSTNGDGVWVNNTRTLKIKILPSFWETPLAWFLYFIIVVLIGFIAMKLISTFYRLRNKIYIEQQLTDIKLRFFTNISHDLRTPLTLITAPLENLLQKNEVPSFAKEQLKLMKRNTDLMLKLVNQILDFRKLQNNKMKLTVEQIEVVAFISQIMEDFQHLAKEQHILFTFNHSAPECYIWADADKLAKIMFNLLSNAFKYTETGKRIEINLKQDDKNLYLEVKDEGIGIPQNKQKEVFNRFNTLNGHSTLDVPSTGIGLSIVKDLVELHKGSISLRSKEGEGSSFKITFPLGRAHYAPDTEFVMQDSRSEERKVGMPQTNEELESISPILPINDNNKQRLLLVEDNLDMRSFLHSIFEAEYNVLEAPNGQVGFEMACQSIPDIIVSDVMMPIMDGIQLVTKLKSEMTTSHIPVILLTAKSAIESKLDAMKEGADDYITKPFSAAYLKARTENLLKQRKKLQTLYCQSLMEPQPNKEEEQEAQEFLSEQDRKFMDLLLKFMEQNLDNSELTVDMLVKNFYMSRSSFFSKLKTLTGLSPIEFIQQMRVKRAAQLIEEDKYSMSEISMMVGITDPHYFSRYFKKAYAMTPTEYKKKIQPQRAPQKDDAD